MSKVKRWLALVGGVALLAASFNVNAAFENITEAPYAFDITALNNVNAFLALSDWEGTTVDIVDTSQLGTSNANVLVGFFDWFADTIDLGKSGTYGIVNAQSGDVYFTTYLLGADIELTGRFSADFRSAFGELRGISPSNMFGNWTMSQIEQTTPIAIPASGWLMFSALGGLLLVPRAREISKT